MRLEDIPAEYDVTLGYWFSFALAPRRSRSERIKARLARMLRRSPKVKTYTRTYTPDPSAGASTFTMTDQPPRSPR